VTGKRDFQKLKNDRMGYLALYNEEMLYDISYLANRIQKAAVEKSIIDK